MYLARELAYNKKGTFSFVKLNVYPINCLKALILETLILANECHFFITITKLVRSNKMIVM